MLDAFSAIGELRHEAPLQNSKRPDIALTLPIGPAGAAAEIVGDIRTVSDRGLDEQNPVDVLGRELARLVRRAGLNGNRFGWHVEGSRQGSYRDGRMRLHLPAAPRLIEIMKFEVAPWLATIAHAPDEPTALEHRSTEAEFKLTYDPRQRYATGSHLSYDVAASRSKNPLFRTLKGKIAQLQAAPEKSVRLIVACDGGCALLARRDVHQSIGNFSAREVTADFLRQNTTIDAVLLVRLDQHDNRYSGRPTFQLQLQLETARQPRSPEVASGLSALAAALPRIAARFPPPLQSADNAARACLHAGAGHDHLGGYTLTEHTISISSRAVLRLLAGAISVEDFREAHGWGVEGGRGDVFTRALQAGETITHAEIQKGPEDDDWLTLRLDWDPASGPFKLSSKAES